MKAVACLFIALGGCATDDSDVGPIITQGGAPTSSTPLVPRTITTRICVLENAQFQRGCTTGAGGGLTVSLGDSVVSTQADGSFTINVPPGFSNTNNPTFQVTGPGIVPSAFPFTFPFMNVGGVPVLDADEFSRALTSNGVPLGLETGTILGTVRDANGPLQGITATTRPGSLFGPFFDSALTNWGVDGTGTRGVIFVPGLTAGMVDLSLQRILGGPETLVAGVTVRNGGVTILDTELLGSTPP